MSAVPTSSKLAPALQAWQSAFAQSQADDSQRTAFESLIELGLPTQRLDDWKYTDLRRLASKQFQLPIKSEAATEGTIASLLLPLTTSRRVIFVDGQLVTSIATSNSLALKGFKQNAFTLLNAAMQPQTQDIVIDDGDELIYVAYIWTEAARSLMSHPRLSLRMSSNSKATLIEQHIGIAGDNFSNSMLNIDIGEHATLEHIRIQDDGIGNFNIANIQVNVQRSGQYSNHHFVFGAGLGRTDLHIKLSGIDAAADLHGLVLAQGSQHLDVYTCIEHAAPHTRSSEDYRGIADQRGRVVFRGKVIVAKDAQKTDAKQSSRNLLLSAQAEIDTRPELEIYANDVKCAHGATVGQLDATSLFYLRSRGIDAAEARALLTHAFAAEVIERIPHTTVCEHVLARLMTRMRSLEVTA